MTIREAVRQGTQLLRTSRHCERSVATEIASGARKGVEIAMTDTPALDSELIMAHTLDIDRSQVIANGNDEVSGVLLAVFFGFIDLRRKGMPVAYVTGTKEFYGLPFTVTPDVLIPKPDTETLVELAIDFAGSHHVENIADICCGSGCVGISIAHECHVPVVFTDISPAALDMCRLNVPYVLGTGASIGEKERSISMQSTYKFFCGDLLDVFPPDRKFSLIVSNPPYIPHDEVAALLSDGRGEPELALDGGADGLEITRRLVSQAAQHLAPGGALMVESSEEGTAQVAAMMLAAGLTGVRTYTDMAGLPRVAVGVAA